ncbi:MAG: hypothetical protein IPJ84_15475 [Bdellovibrionales bacterium]|nr:hypothetical protein [Bdellovibrionales bacterium]
MNLALAILFLSTSILTSTAQTAEGHPPDCKPERGTCDFYLCQEAKQQCGPTGYYQRFGHPYCSAFLEEVRPKLSPRGQEWLKDVAYCLQEDLDHLSRNSDPCWFSEDLAIATHSDCYVKTGACELDVIDLAIVVRTFASELTNSRIIGQSVDFLRKCVF